MAQYSLNAYDADVYIPEFRGLMQYGDPTGGDLRYSPDCLNVETPGGVLQPVAKCPEIRLDLSGTPYFNEPTDGMTMMYIYAQKASSPMAATIGGAPYGSVDEADEYIIAMHGKIYTISKTLGDLKETKGYTIYETSMPTGVSEFTSNRFAWTTYEIAGTLPGQQNAKNNVIVMCNADGNFWYNGHQIRAISSTTVTLPAFDCVATFAERIWGAKGDMVYYSKPFSVTDWELDNTNPASGGGVIRLATFDRDKIVAMRQLGDSLILFSEKRAWKISVSDPFMIQEQYGNGCLYPKTIAVMDNRIVMLGEGGLLVYDGYQVQPFLREQTSELFRSLHMPYHYYEGAMIGDKYVLANTGDQEIDLGTLYPEYRDFDINENGELINPARIKTGEAYRALVYDKLEGTVTLRDDLRISSFCKGTPYAAFERGVHPQGAGEEYYAFITKINFDSWHMNLSADSQPKWVSPWITLGRQDIKKGGFDLYFTPEIEATKEPAHQYWEDKADQMYGNPVFVYGDDPSECYVRFKISIQTEKKTKVKYYTVNRLTDSTKNYRMKRLHFGGSGRRFRIIIEQATAVNATWRLISGIHVIAETDKD